MPRNTTPDLDDGLDATVCAMAFRRGDSDLPEIDDDDMVIVVKGAYGTVGEPTTNGSRAKSDEKYRDTRIIATSPGRFTWLSRGEPKGNHPSSRKVGVKLTVMLSSPAKALAAKGEVKKAEGMSQLI